jgi:predicted O-methyltransferase YrrM
MGRFVSAALQAVGLRASARQLKYKTRQFKYRMRARGWLGWRPLVPETDFSQCCLNAIQLLKESGEQIGDYLEFGVSRGTSYACMYHALRQSGLSDVRLIGFDSFEGFPKEAAEQGWEPGDAASTIGATTRYLSEKGVPYEAMNFVKGWYKDTLTPESKDKLKLNKASLVMIDCDIYTASRDALRFCAPFLTDRAVIIFDDWGWRSDLGKIGQKEAFDEFLSEFPQFSAEPLPSYLPQARVFLLTRRAPIKARHIVTFWPVGLTWLFQTIGAIAA